MNQSSKSKTTVPTPPSFNDMSREEAINALLVLLKELWMENDNWRFCQLLFNIITTSEDRVDLTGKDCDFWYTKDSEVYHRILEMIESERAWRENKCP